VIDDAGECDKINYYVYNHQPPPFQTTTINYSRFKPVSFEFESIPFEQSNAHNSNTQARECLFVLSYRPWKSR